MSDQNSVQNENNDKSAAKSEGRYFVDITPVYLDLDKIVRHDACFYETEQTVPRYLKQNILAPYIRFREMFKEKTELEGPPLEKILELYLENHAYEAIPDNYREREVLS